MMIWKPMIDEEQIILKKKFNFQRCFYSLVGLGTTIAVILLTVGQIQQMKSNDPELAIALLFIVHSVAVLVSLLSTAIVCQITNAVLTTLTIILLSAYSGVHFYLRYVLFYNHLQDDFYLLIVRLAFVSILLILVVPWTNVLVREYRLDVRQAKPIEYAKSTTFSWFLYLDFILMISLMILTVRYQTKFDLDQILRLSVGLPLVLVWFTLGLVMIKRKIFHWLILMIFNFLSLVHIFHLVSLTYSTISEYRFLSGMHEWTFAPLLILRCVTLGTDLLIHTLTMIISCLLIGS